MNKSVPTPHTKKGDTLSIIIPAAGEGTRLGLGPKAFLELNERPLIYWLSQKALKVTDNVLIAAPTNSPDQRARLQAICPDGNVIEGGTSHLESMAILARHCRTALIMNLNVSMPFISIKLMLQLVEAAEHQKIVAAATPLVLPVFVLENAEVINLLSRKTTAIANGPNVYNRLLFQELVSKATPLDWRRQSFLEIAHAHGYPIHTIVGEKTNIKITSQEDWLLAQNLKDLLK